MSVEEKVRKFIFDNFLFTDDQNAILNSDSFLDKGVLDSTGILEVINFLEEEFGLTVNDDELVPENLDSVDNITAFVNRKAK